MRVLHIVGFYPEFGGPYTVVRGLTKELVRKGCSVSVYSPLPQGYDKSKLEDHTHLDEVQYFDQGFLSHFWPSYSSEWSNFVDKINSYDLIHIHGIFDYFAYFIARNIQKPYIIRPYGSLSNLVIKKKSRLRKRLYLRLIGRSVLNNSAGIHLLTKQEANDLRNLELGINQDLFSVIPNGVEIYGSSKSPPKGFLFEKFPYLRGKRLVLFLGRINWKKGLDDLIPAFADVVTTISNAHLVLVGPDSDGYMNQVNKLINIHKIENNVSYSGPAYGEDKTMFMQDCEVFVLPSFSEGFPVTAIEAMSFAMPVMLTEDSGIPDIIMGAKAGLVVKKNKDEIASGILKLLNDKQLAAEMGRNGELLVKKEFLWSNIASKVIELYKDALRKKVT
ncbi:MAG: glycosyltransferase [Candidatus Dadabacteria bacterium]|nr:glycosyltransferase [Candidatus Dadabacteria bacterium]